jgi:vanillate O-demethylase ferredoxin subunit
MNHVIAAITPHGSAVKEFRIARADGSTLPAWPPGAHIVLRFAGRDGTQYERHYSLVGPAGAAASYRIAVLRLDDGQGGSRTLFDDMGAGTPIEVDGPFDSFPLLPADGPARVVLVAGGIGITPLVSMAHALSARGQPFELHYLVHSASRLALLDELRAIPHARLVLHVSDQEGRADLAAILGRHAGQDACYACGPVALMQALREAAAQLDWPAGALHTESFGARAQPGDAALTVELSMSQTTLTVPPGQSILDAMIAADIFVSYECKRGECGNCYAAVLEGAPLHRDLCLTPEQRAVGMCTCVSWAGGGKLVLEL